MRLLNREKLEAWLKKQVKHYTHEGIKQRQSMYYEQVLNALDQFAVEDEPNEEGLLEKMSELETIIYGMDTELHGQPAGGDATRALSLVREIKHSVEHPPQKED